MESDMRNFKKTQRDFKRTLVESFLIGPIRVLFESLAVPSRSLHFRRDSGTTPYRESRVPKNDSELEARIFSTTKKDSLAIQKTTSPAALDRPSKGQAMLSLVRQLVTSSALCPCSIRAA